MLRSFVQLLLELLTDSTIEYFHSFLAETVHSRL